jgi:predicted nuclease of predicted toxin-antitoxin system
MKFLFDQNISFRILKSLPLVFCDSSHVKKEGLINSPDREIWEFAKIYNYTIVTQDSDFNDLNSLYGFPPKVIWIRTGNLKTQFIVDILLNHFSEIERFITDDTYGCFEIYKFRNK